MKPVSTLPPVRQQTEPQPDAPPTPQEGLRQIFAALYVRFRVGFLLAAGVAMALGAVRLYDFTRPPPQHLTQRDINAAVERALATATPKPSYASEAYAVIMPSVVSIVVLNREAEGKNEGALGTGVVVDDRGDVLTSLHIIRDATEIHIVFADGSESEASVVARQPENDLAVLEPSEIPDDLVPATLGSSTVMHVGDEVVAVGNPFGIHNSVSAGVISGFGRTFKSANTGETFSGLIQFDAAVNPGNSGGPLVNRDGEVIGIVTALLNPTTQDVFIGIGFAVPIETAGGLAGAPPV